MTFLEMFLFGAYLMFATAHHRYIYDIRNDNNRNSYFMRIVSRSAVTATVSLCFWWVDVIIGFGTWLYDKILKPKGN